MNYKYKLEDFKDIKELAEWKKECKLLFVVTDNSKYQSPDKAKGCIRGKGEPAYGGFMINVLSWDRDYKKPIFD